MHLLGLPLIALVLGCSSSEDKTSPWIAPTNSTYATSYGDVNMSCSGSGHLPVIFLAGGAERGSTWGAMRNSLGPTVLSCAFDRPGVSPSYAPDELLSPDLVSDVLAEVLDAAGIGSRFVFVGHSIGGLHLRSYGKDHGDQIAAAIFLDPTVPDFATLFTEEFSGLGYDPDVTRDQGNAVITWDSDASVEVLSRDAEVAGQPAAFTIEQQELWSAGQTVYAGLTASGSQEDVPLAGHYIYRDAPERVLAAIQNALPTQ